MSDMGIYVNPTDGGKGFFLSDNDARIISFVTRLRLSQYDHEYHSALIQRKLSSLPGYKFIIIPIRTSLLGRAGPSYSIQEQQINNLRIEGDYFKCEINLYLDSPSYYPHSNREFIVDIYTYAESFTGDYGIYLKGMNGVTEITDSSRLGYCVFRKKVTITGGTEWSLPSNIPNKDTCLVFARCDDQNVIISMNENKQIWCNTTAVVYIAVFSSGFSLKVPDYGIYILNKQNNYTYTSEYVPFFMGETFRIDRSVGRTLIKKPMFQISELQYQFRKDKGNYYFIVASGVKCNSNEISMAHGRIIGREYIDAYSASTRKININMYAIDCDKYF
ncbi:DUF6453 family protein [Photorhabdus khanii]|uniref:Uncharacterized protein n=1 Tax=Photorhabdus khanii subsp. guanajuatensis TaxID=2100166 RepID=A0A4V2X7T8_9GAMM|nr:DUF6453 family protein [Photorhabdus khanii]TDB57255.1 hypothetical protein C5467_11445 [Photorhabdus khanii subsp. guanajuatensis]